jgi:gamma-glutamyl hydrolase
MMHHMILLLHYLSTAAGSSTTTTTTPSRRSIQPQQLRHSPSITTIDHQQQYLSDPHHYHDHNVRHHQQVKHFDRSTRIDPWLFTGVPFLIPNDIDDNSKDEVTSTTTIQLPPPVVGILAQPYYNHHYHYYSNTATVGEQEQNQQQQQNQQQYIAASYIKWIESGGGRSVYIPYDTTNDTLLDNIYHQINGLLLPGGNNSTLPYSVSYLLRKVLTSQTNGIYFPVWGTCLGFEMIIQFIGDMWSTTTIDHVSSSNTIVTTVLQDGFNSSNISLPLIVLDDYDNIIDQYQPSISNRMGTIARSTTKTTTTTTPTTKTTRTVKGHLYKPNQIYYSVTQYPITMNNHHQGIEPNQFVQSKNLISLFDITSINYDLNYRPFVSTIEPKDPYQYPIYGVQYHPEKNPFEYSTIGIDFSFYLSKFFMNCVRYNQYHFQQYHQYTDPISFPLTNTYPIISGGLSFEEVYIFPYASH